MLYYFAALLSAAAVVWLVHPRRDANRWAGIFLFSAATGGTSEWLEGHGWLMASSVVQYANLTITPYAALVFALVYGGWLRTGAARRVAKLLPLAPVIGMAGWTTWTPSFAIHYPLLAVWAGLYYLAACALLLLAWRRESDRHLRRSRRITAVIMTPTLLAVYGLIYIGRAIDPDFPFFGYVSGFVAYSLGLGLLLSWGYGVLGVRVRVEGDPMEPALQAASSGASMLHHAIKNELGKIAISTANLRREVEGRASAEDHLRIISASSEHLLAMVSRIHGQMKELSLQLEPCSPQRIIEELLPAYRERMAAAGIAVVTDYGRQAIVLADPVHLREACSNLINNAIEAMPEGGELRIDTELHRRQALLRFADSGHGLAPAQAARVFEPYYSTKGGGSNYGLGLTYVYRVMTGSGGSARLESREGEGTTVTLSFPRMRQREEVSL